MFSRRRSSAWLVLTRFTGVISRSSTRSICSQPGNKRHRFENFLGISLLGVGPNPFSPVNTRTGFPFRHPTSELGVSRIHPAPRLSSRALNPTSLSLRPALWPSAVRDENSNNSYFESLSALLFTFSSINWHNQTTSTIHMWPTRLGGGTDHPVYQY